MRPQGAPQQRRAPSESHSRPLISAETGTQRPYSWPQAAWAFTAARTSHHSAGKGKRGGRPRSHRQCQTHLPPPPLLAEKGNEHACVAVFIERTGAGLGGACALRERGWTVGGCGRGSGRCAVAVGACAVGRRERRPPAVRGGHGGPAPAPGPVVRYRVAGATHRQSSVGEGQSLSTLPPNPSSPHRGV